MCSLSETSSSAGGLFTNQATEFPAADHARNLGALQLAVLGKSTSGKALLAQHQAAVTAPELATAAHPMEDPAAKAQRQTAQLAALLSTESGKALMQQHLRELITHKQLAALQQQQLQQQQPVTPTNHANGTSISPAMAVAEQADETTCSSSDLHPRVLSTAIAVSRTAPGSAGRAAGLALLKQELMQHAALSTALALAAAGSGNKKLVEAAAAALSKAQAMPEPRQQVPQHHQQLQDKAPLSPNNSDLAANGEPLTCAAAWAMLQQKQQQQQSQDNTLTGAMNLGLLRNDTLHSMQSMSMRQDSAIDTAAIAPVSQGVDRAGSQQMVFKRRTTNSTALRRHFSHANKPVRSEPSTVNKPHQLFKSQRKKPLVLWSSSSNLQQQLSTLRQQQQQQQGALPAFSVPVEPEYSTVTASSSGATGPAVQALLDAHLPVLYAAAAAAAVAAPGTRTSGVDNVLGTLARQEQQLLVLQQQLRQQRKLISTKQPQVAAAGPAPSAAALAAVKALELEMLLGNNAAPAAFEAESVHTAAADVEMSDAYHFFERSATAAVAAPQQHQETEPAGINADAISTLMTLAKVLIATQQQQQQQQPASAAHAPVAAAAAMPTENTSAAQGWDPDVVRRLTAALLAA